MAGVRWERYPLVAGCPAVRTWLQIQADLGLASNTIDAYGRALQDYLSFSKRVALDLELATRAHVASYVRDLMTRPSPRGVAVRALDSGAGLANATLQQRLTAVRLFYDYLIEEGMRTDNPVGRGRYTPGKGFGGARDRGLIPRYRKLPWIPSDKQAVLDREATQIAFARNAPQPPKGGKGPPPNVQPVPGRLVGTRIPAGVPARAVPRGRAGPTRCWLRPRTATTGDELRTRRRHMAPSSSRANQAEPGPQRRRATPGRGSPERGLRPAGDHRPRCRPPPQ